MFIDNDLKNHLETSSVIRSSSAIIAEWNMNIYNNIFRVGNYRYRPNSSSIYRSIPNIFDINDSGSFYTNATNSDVVIDGGFSDDNSPELFKSNKEKSKLLFSLEDCFTRFRPRSGINKATYFNNRYIHHSNPNIFNRPRYYMADKYDKFKYWTSYRTEDGIERGVANQFINGQYYIDDAAPFIVYKNKVPANRIIVKMQTNTGDIDLGPFSNSVRSYPDPFYGDNNKTTPIKWKIQYLQNNNWVDAISFGIGSVRSDGTPIIKSDGYVELSYGLKIPDKYKEVFIKAEEYSSSFALPEKSVQGYAYLIKADENDIGTYHIWFDGDYETFKPEYGWVLQEETVDRLTNFVTDLTDPQVYTSSLDGTLKYREFEYIEGLRVVIETMNKVDSTFDLIELSPRLTVNLTDKTNYCSVNKVASDLSNSGLPVSQLLASTGSITLFDYDLAFSDTNTKSIIKNYVTNHIQFKIYDVVMDVDGYDYFIPIKTLYSEGFPQVSNTDREVTLNLRDLYFYFESISAPELLITDASLSYAVSLLLDSVGFSNYVFKRVEGETEITIPYFFTGKDKTVAEVLSDLALSSQSAMFFDEYNNFVMMSKNYMMPKTNERSTDLVLYGTKDFVDSGIIENETTKSKLANIIEIVSQDNNIYNDGVINYTTRYIQRSYGSLRQASLIDQEKTWIYKPVLLWEVSASQNTKSVNGQVSSQSSYVLSAIPLNSTLSVEVPIVSNHQVINNTMDLGEGVYWITRYNGYFYSNGEIIKYDAVQFNVSGIGNIWINNVQEYQNYFSKLPFNGKIYPTGLVRIYSEPNYEVINGITRLKNGAVAKHGRGQFGTSIVNHYAGLNPYWADNSNVRGCTMKSQYLFNLTPDLVDPNKSVGPAGISNSLATKTTRNGIIKNFLTSSYLSEVDVNNLKATQTGTIQSSALVMNGPSFTTTEKPIDFISYVYKPLTDKFKHFGTRVRIIGKIENNDNRVQSPTGSNIYYVTPGTTPDQSISIGGGSGGLGVMLNPSTNNGYYFEIVALTEGNMEQYAETGNVYNILFYKIMQETGTTNAVPVLLWGGLSNILVDDGKFTGQYRMTAEENPTVYDLAVEYQDIGTIRRFFLYINNKLIKVVDDQSPLPAYNNMALFVRGSSRCMFENIYAITNNYTQNTSYALDTPVASAYEDSEIDTNESFRKYAMSGVIQSTYLSGISPAEPPKYKIYFEEFGTIMREAVYFNIKYDRAYPALYAKLSPTFNRIKGYTVSGFRAGSYGAEFMIFNATDTALSLDETSGNYLRIQGITFTQESNYELTVDDFYSKKSNFSDPEISGSNLVSSPLKYSSDYQDIKVSRMTYGKNEFSLDVPYIQTQDDANNLMSWLLDRVTKPRKSVGVKVFGMPIVQLGDLVQIDYKDSNSVDQVGDYESRFIVYNIEYDKDVNGPNMTMYLSEVPK